jgi:hypothetical protein
VIQTHGACSSECPGSSSRMYPALEGLTAVVYRGLVPPPSQVRRSMCMPVTPAVPYLLLGLQDVQWAVGNSRGARKLARTPHMNQKKKKKPVIQASSRSSLSRSYRALLCSPQSLAQHKIFSVSQATGHLFLTHKK